MWSQDITWEISTNPAGLSWYQDTRATSTRSKLSGAKAHSQFLPNRQGEQEQSSPWRRVSWKQRVTAGTGAQSCRMGWAQHPAPASNGKRPGATQGVRSSRRWVHRMNRKGCYRSPRLQCRSEDRTCDIKEPTSLFRPGTKAPSWPQTQLLDQ